jgi:hypothetical protein
MFAPSQLKRLTVVTGHYGCGKTNLSINLALDLAHAGERVTLVDLDVVNPYFRSSDSASLLAENGVRLISPTFAGTALDVPSLPAEVYGALDPDAGRVIIDVGGDDAGATALGRYAREIAELDHDLLYVANRYRNLTSSASDAAGLLGEIEGAAHLSASGVVNNSHLQAETTAETILSSLAYAREVAETLGLPLVCTTVPRRIAGEFSAVDEDTAGVENAYPIDVYVRPPWDDSDPAGVKE